MVCQGLNESRIDEIWRPMFEYIRSNSDLTIKEELWTHTMPARHFWDAEYRRSHGSHSMINDSRPDASPTHAWWSGDQEQVGIVLYGYESAWLPASLLAPSQRQRLVAALFAASRHQEVELHFNKGLAGAPPEHITAATNTATNPQALSAFCPRHHCRWRASRVPRTSARSVCGRRRSAAQPTTGERGYAGTQDRRARCRLVRVGKQFLRAHLAAVFLGRSQLSPPPCREGEVRPRGVVLRAPRSRER